jgi:hypothetical protein
MFDGLVLMRQALNCQEPRIPWECHTTRRKGTKDGTAWAWSDVDFQHSLPGEHQEFYPREANFLAGCTCKAFLRRPYSRFIALHNKEALSI